MYDYNKENLEMTFQASSEVEKVKIIDDFLNNTEPKEFYQAVLVRYVIKKYSIKEKEYFEMAGEEKLKEALHSYFTVIEELHDNKISDASITAGD